MSYIKYISTVNEESFDSKLSEYNFSEELKNAIIGENHYPLIEHHDDKDLFVIILPVYNIESNSLSLVECDIIKDKEYCLITTDLHEDSINNLIHQVNHKGHSNNRKIFDLIMILCTHILQQINILEKKISDLKNQSMKNAHYNEQTINAIMQLKLDVGMFKSTTNPFTDIIWHLFDTIIDTQDTVHEFKKNQIDHLVKQITSQTLFLYENISIVAETCNAIQNIHANNIMKRLTIISSIFIPLSFITGIFGMNFVHMPGLDRIGWYYITLIGMLFIGLSQLYVFKKKGRF